MLAAPLTSSGKQASSLANEPMPVGPLIGASSGDRNTQPVWASSSSSGFVLAQVGWTMLTPMTSRRPFMLRTARQREAHGQASEM